MNLNIEHQEAVFSTLSNAALGCSIYETVPDGAAFPHIFIGEDVLTSIPAPYDPLTTWWEVSTTVHIFSRLPSNREVKGLAGEVFDALFQPLTYANFSCEEWDGEQILHMTDPDGSTRHSVVRLNYTVQPI